MDGEEVYAEIEKKMFIKSYKGPEVVKSYDRPEGTRGTKKYDAQWGSNWKYVGNCLSDEYMNRYPMAK